MRKQLEHHGITAGSEVDLVQELLLDSQRVLERLGERLVALEQTPDDRDLVSDTVRGLHTIKGAAGFLALPELVEVCHRCEGALQRQAQGGEGLTPRLIEALFWSLDVIDAMLERVAGARSLEPAPDALLQTLRRHSALDVGAPATATAAGNTEQASQVDTPAPNSAGATDSGDDGQIGEAEFERLLDELHGEGRHQGVPSVARTKPIGNTTKAERGASSIRVDPAKLDDLMTRVRELTALQTRLEAFSDELGDTRFGETLEALKETTTALEASLVTVRMQAIGALFQRFRRLIRDLGRTLGKEVELSISGENTELDRGLIEMLAEPLIHLIRNALDHGLEPPEERELAGKSRSGNVHLAAEREGNTLILSVTDDGRGVDADNLRDVAIRRGLIEPEAARAMAEGDVYDLIFTPGFSTSKQVSEVSGRGIGMDIVNNCAAKLNGSVGIDSQATQGTRIWLKLALAFSEPATAFASEHAARHTAGYPRWHSG